MLLQVFVNYPQTEEGAKELSQILNVVPDTITRWINGNIVISKDNYYKIKKMLEN